MGFRVIGWAFCACIAFGNVAKAGYTFVDLYVFDQGARKNHPEVVIPGGQAAGFIEVNTPAGSDAAIWSQSGVLTDIHPGVLGFDGSRVWFTTGSQQAGAAFFFVVGAPEVDHAVIWNNTAASAVDLHPTQFGLPGSAAFATDGIHQVGDVEGSNSLVSHAILWSGTAASAVDLTPTKLFGVVSARSEAFGLDGDRQVGFASDKFGVGHAVMWQGTADSAIALAEPQGISYSLAGAISGNQIVGSGRNSGDNAQHAMVWIGTDPTGVDLDGSYFVSNANGTNGIQQVGVGVTSFGTPGKPLLWSGTAASVVDLSTYMPTTPTADLTKYFTDSSALSIDAAGNIFGVATDGAGNGHVVEWAVTPEPGTAGLLLVIGSILIGKRKRT